ncbi:MULTISPECIES: phage holin family protein [Serratia]|uniref:phage holin family protein n=1 Tax=Serratia TaxID=613 RepID=UPI00146B7AE7|nr:phage holin family protein [Serratia marcescens]MBN5199322.1 phage holin family protein [Serratia marcescens]MBN5299947.1 phage holin family protein [Serratia marcescens]NMT26024.1 holin [Serratia marcescens]HEP0391471.1 phage holin family protein [Serratia marcescens]
MPDKEINHIFSSLWVVFILIAGWGGVVRYLMDIKRNKAAWSWVNALAQIVVSSFTGLIGGIVSMETGLSVNMAFVGAGLCGAMGSVALTYFWERFFGGINENQR